MSEYKVNEQCIIGMPACGYGFNSARMCFIARPADAEFQLEEDILTQVLSERNYETYVALQRIDPGNLAFCTKICSKIITSHFCIALLNQSRHADHPDIKISNPNVHLEYGMMLSFHKHVIPMQRESEVLPFNIYPIDTVKYRPDTFKTMAETAIDDAILRFTTREPPGRPIGAASDVLKYFSFRGLRYTPISDESTRAVFALGQAHGFNLFDGADKIIFFGYFHEEEPREIAIRARFLLQNIELAYARVEASDDGPEKERARRILDQLALEVLVPEACDSDQLAAKISQFQAPMREISLTLHKPSDIERVVHEEYERMAL